MRMKNLERYRIGGGGTRMHLGLPLPKTPDGRVYRYSPNVDAHPRHFVLGARTDGHVSSAEAQARMKQPPGSPRTVCPYSGTIAWDQNFSHPDDQDAAIAMVGHAALEDAKEHMRRAFEGIARRSKGFIKFKPGGTTPKPKPRFKREDLLRELVCDHCGRDYGVYAIALFCPDCGAPNLRLHFQREAALVDAQIILAEGLDERQQELAYRLLGNAHEDVLTAFEATQKTVYLYGIVQRPAGAPPIKPVANDFQNIDRSRTRFQDLALDPFQSLDAIALDALSVNVQKRHIIGHNLGVVDAKFAQHAQNALVGETVKLVSDDIRIFAGLCQAVIDDLDAWLAGGKPAPTLTVIPMPPPLQSPEPDMDKSLDVIDASALAKRVGIWIAKSSSDGRPGLVSPAALAAEFADIPEKQLEEALAELEMEGCGTVSRHFGPGLPRFAITPNLFVVFDKAAVDNDPTADSCELARRVLEDKDAIDVDSLGQASGWPPRRFNPAIWLVSQQIDDRRVLTGSMNYVVRAMHMLAEDRVALRRYVERLS
jgi:hypothetical protein